jgi:hypothetical protein
MTRLVGTAPGGDQVARPIGSICRTPPDLAGRESALRRSHGLSKSTLALLPPLGSHLRHPAWRTALLLDRGPSSELEKRSLRPTSSQRCAYASGRKPRVATSPPAPRPSRDPLRRSNRCRPVTADTDHLLSAEYGPVAHETSFHLDGRECPCRVLTATAVHVQLSAEAATTYLRPWTGTVISRGGPGLRPCRPCGPPGFAPRARSRR